MVSAVNVRKVHLNVARANEELGVSRRGKIYRAVEQLGQGRRGNVFLCDNLDHEQNNQPVRVALRFLPRQPSNASGNSLNSEISTHWLLNHHPNVLNFYTILLTHSFVVIVMEYAPGGTLASYITSLITHTSIQQGRHHRSSGQPSTLSSTLTATNTHTDVSMASDCSHSGRHSQRIDRSPERKRMVIVQRLFQQLICVLEYVQLCGISLGEFQPECFMVAFDSEDGGLPMPSLRLSHFGHLHSEHPTEEAFTSRSPTAVSDPDVPFCAADLVHWTQTHAKPHLAPPPTLDPTRDAGLLQGPNHTAPREPTTPAGHSSSGASHHSSQSFHSRSASLCRSQEREREKCASRMLDIASAGSVLFYMLHGCEPFPTDGEEMIKSWRSKDASGITWPSRSSSRSHAGELISWMLQPPEERCTLEDVKQELFFCENLPESLHMVTNNACNDELTAEQLNSIMKDIRDIIYVSRKPAVATR